MSIIEDNIDSIPSQILMGGGGKQTSLFLHCEGSLTVA